MLTKPHLEVRVTWIPKPTHAWIFANKFNPEYCYSDKSLTHYGGVKFTLTCFQLKNVH